MKRFNAKGSRARGRIATDKDCLSVAKQNGTEDGAMNAQDWETAWKAAHDAAFVVANRQCGKADVEDDAHPLVGYPTAEAWIEAGHYIDRGAELRLSFAEPLPGGYADFWVPFSSSGGVPLFWLRFSLLAVIKGRSVFAATEARPATEPAPPEQAQLRLLLAPLLAGFAPPR